MCSEKGVGREGQCHGDAALPPLRTVRILIQDGCVLPVQVGRHCDRAARGERGK